MDFKRTGEGSKDVEEQMKKVCTMTILAGGILNERGPFLSPYDPVRTDSDRRDRSMRVMGL